MRLASQDKRKSPTRRKARRVKRRILLEGTMEKGISRRNFLTGALATAGVAAVAMTGCSPQTASEGGSSSAAAQSESVSLLTQTPAWLGEAPEIGEDEIVETKQTSLLIIGAGNAGMTAAATAADLGLDFIIAEKAGQVAKTRSWYGAVNIEECLEGGQEVDTIKLNNVLRQSFCGMNDMRVVRVWIDESAEMHTWMRSIMDQFGYDVNFDGDQGDGRGGVGIEMYVPPIQVNYVAREDCSEEHAEMARNELLEEYIGDKGYQVTYNHDLAKLVTDESGAVKGAIFSTGDGYVQIDAENVLLTTGGYAANPEMVAGINPILAKCVTLGVYWPANTGMGIKAAMWAGAMKDPNAAAFVFDRGAVPPGTKGGYTQESIEAGEPAFPSTGAQFNPGTQPFLKMNLHGERFFNESGNYDWAPYAAASQPNGVYVEVWDAGFAEDVKRFHGLGCSSTTNVMINQVGKSVDEYLKDWLDNGSLIKADTLDELADKLGYEGEYKENFLATIERYNELYDAQEDPDFGKEPYLLSQMRNAPFYGVTLGGALLDTSDGLRINTDMQVLNTDADVIPGLYAAGDCSGSVFAGGYYNLTHGMAVGRSMTFARHAVRRIAGDLD